MLLADGGGIEEAGGGPWLAGGNGGKLGFWEGKGVKGSRMSFF